jgi:hypothetical protein
MAIDGQCTLYFILIPAAGLEKAWRRIAQKRDIAAYESQR